jgi:hypothetical protein
MNKQKKHTIYTESDIQNYLSGRMSNPEMHAIEKAAMEDPLLAEAIEGYEVMEQKDWSNELAVLKNKLSSTEHKSGAPVYSFRKWWRAAAAVLILTAGIAVTYFFSSRKEAAVTELATVTAPDSAPVYKTDTIVSFNNADKNVAEITKDNQQKSTAVVSAPGSSKSDNMLIAKATSQGDSSSFVYKPLAKPADSYAASIATEAYDFNKSANIHETADLEKNLARNNNAASNGILNTNKNSADQFNGNNNVIQGTVVTADDKPVAFANVTPAKSRKPVYTDAKGNFKIPATDSIVDAVVTSAGYLSKKINLKNVSAENKIVLQQDTVHLTVISSAKTKTEPSPVLQKNIENADEDDAEPAGGWVEYNNYINENLVLPNAAKQNNIHGVVEVFVKLKNNGDISQVKVDKPLCTECDAEAIRLVKEGPKWEVKGKKAKKAKVKIKF